MRIKKETCYRGLKVIELETEMELAVMREICGLAELHLHRLEREAPENFPRGGCNTFSGIPITEIRKVCGEIQRKI